MVSEDLAVEVFGSNRAWYKAWIINVYKTNALCTFENGWKDNQRVPFMNIRLPPVYPTNYPFSLNEDVEVLSNTEPSCWWPANINRIAKDRRTYSIVYKKSYYSADNKADYGDMVGKDRLRPTTENFCLNQNTFYKFSAEVPDKMRECADIPGVLDDKAFEKFKESTKASLIRYDPDTNEIVVLTRNIGVYRDVEMCFDYQLSLLEKKVDLLSRHQKFADRLQSPPQEVSVASPSTTQRLFHKSRSTSQQCVEEFTIHPNFMGLAIGTRGKNINLARKIPGIVGLDLDEEQCLFKIVGETKEAVTDARNMLEYGEKSIEVDPKYAPKMIGRKGVTIQDIVDQSGCVRVRIENPERDGEVMCKFIFVGTLSALKYVQIMMSCQMQYVKETTLISNQNTQSDRELREKIYSPKPPSVPIRQGAPLLTPRQPITPPTPYPCNDKQDSVNTGAVYDKQHQKALLLPHAQTLLQTPTLPTGSVPRTSNAQTAALPNLPPIERLCIETQTEPLEEVFVKPAAPTTRPVKQTTRHDETARSGTPSPRVPLQKRTTVNSRISPRDPINRSNVREPVRRTARDSPRAPIRERNAPSARPARSNTKPLLGHKPKVDIKMVHEKIGTALGAGSKVKDAEEVRTEQLAAIEDLVKLEAKEKTPSDKVDKQRSDDDDKENSVHVAPVNNQNFKMEEKNDNEKRDNDKRDNEKRDNDKRDNDNLSGKIEEPLIQTIMNVEVLSSS